MANKKVNQLTSKPAVNLTDLFLIADPTSGQAYKTTISDLGTAIGSGVSSVNSLVGAVVLDTDDIQELVSPTNKWFTDTRARAALSASSPLTYNSGTGAFGIQVANGSQNGYLSSADWTTFNAKQAALSGTGFVKISGTTISYDNSTYLTTSAAASTYLALAGGELTGALLGTSAAFSGYVGIGNSSPLYNLDVTGSGRFSGDLRIESTNPRIYLTDTDNNPDYFISNTDGTFTVYDVTNSLSRLTISTSGATFLNSVTSSGYYLTGMTSGSGALYYNSAANRVTVANYNTSGIVVFEVNGGAYALTLNSDTSATFAGAISGTSSSFSGNVVGLQLGVGGQTPRTTSSLKTIESTNYVLEDNGDFGLKNNAYYNGTNNVYINNGYASRVYLSSGSYIYYDAPSGTTGGTVTFTPRFTIANGGAATFSSSVTAASLNLGGTTGDRKLEIQKSSVSNFDAFRIAGGSTTLLDFTTTSVGNSRMSINDSTGTTKVYLSSYDSSYFMGGSVGIGTASPSGELHVKAASGFAELYVQGGSSTSGMYLFDQNTESGLWKVDSGYMAFGTSNTERMRITSGGYVLIGSTTPNWSNANRGLLEVNGTSQALIGLKIGDVGKSYLYHDGSALTLYNGTGSTYVQSQTNGVYLASNATSWTANSDIRLKNINSEITDALGKLSSLRAINYCWKSDSTNKENIGLIAQEVSEVLPQLIDTNKDGFLGVRYSELVPVLVQAVKELKAELDTLKTK